MTVPKDKVYDAIGWMGLGVCIDYFILRPVRLLRPLFYVAVGFAIGAVFIAGLERIGAFVHFTIG